jgi:autotransporter-associated beta strand protein
MQPGCGFVTFNETPATYGTANLVINTAQAWNNQSSSPLTIQGNSATAITVNQPLEIGGSGNTTIANLAYLAGNGGITKTGSGMLTVGNNAGAAGNTRFTIDSLRGGNFRMEGGSLVISPTQYFTIGESAGGNAAASYTQIGGNATYTGSSGLYIGNWTSGSNNTATFSVEGGSFTQNSNITYVGRQTGSGTATGRLSVGGGSKAAIFTAPTVSIGGAAANSINTGEVTLRSQGTLVTGLINKPGGAAHLSFDGGTLRVRPGTSNGSVLLGNVLNSATITSLGAAIDTNGTDVTIAQGFANAASATGSLTKTGAGTLTLSGQHSYTGNTTVTEGTLILASGGRLTLRPLSNGQSSKLTGAGSVAVNGTIHLDLTAAAPVNGNAWMLVDTATKSFGSTFALTSTLAAPFQKSGAQWTAADGERTWSFDETTGILTLVMPTAFSRWIETFTDLPANQRDPSLDPDQDGASNLEEFAFDGDPSNPSDRGKKHVLSTATRNLVLSAAMRENTPAFTGSPAPFSTVDGIIYQVEGSDNLGTFALPVVEITPLIPAELPAPRAGYTYRSFALETEGAQGFLRVGVSEN